jgi:hypothetical protein
MNLSALLAAVRGASKSKTVKFNVAAASVVGLAPLLLADTQLVQMAIALLPANWQSIAVVAAGVVNVYLRSKTVESLASKAGAVDGE